MTTIKNQLKGYANGVYKFDELTLEASNVLSEYYNKLNKDENANDDHIIVFDSNDFKIALQHDLIKENIF